MKCDIKPGGITLFLEMSLYESNFLRDSLKRDIVSQENMTIDDGCDCDEDSCVFCVGLDPAKTIVGKLNSILPQLSKVNTVLKKKGNKRSRKEQQLIDMGKGTLILLNEISDRLDSIGSVDADSLIHKNITKVITLWKGMLNEN